MKDDIFKKIEQKALKLKSADIDKAIQSIAKRFNLDLSQIAQINETVSGSTRRASLHSALPIKRDISFSESDENTEYKQY